MTPTGRPCRLVVCRGCCCGTAEKRPGVDHEGQLERLRSLRGGDVPVHTSTCLGICFQANVVVVQPSSAGRERGGRPVWLGGVTEDRLIDDLDAWIRDGGPGAAPMPESLARRVTSEDAEKPEDEKSKKDKKKKKDKKDQAGEESEQDKKPGKDKKDQKSTHDGKQSKPGKHGKPGKPGKAEKDAKAQKYGNV
ncbi:(2Fe-2S) ferredoxin domain-containing protein [Streptomonospora salina]|uniref:(2Fe-2S) ferredoxin n=1 Tax=Streptomonospora salina TaxID=104205 RepID=A0A841EHL4_9ACTN|nr:(2Fe-2S) ferredoxin domain-containing protein [Streptomonospora salina]MBB6000318.1 (2Fe-2S) ferredoxin [Streptomonospora salina]